MEQPLTLPIIIEKIKKNRSALQSYGVKNIGVFGSFVKEEQDISSDIDILVEFEKGMKTFDNFMGVLFFLEDLFKINVDLVTKEALSPHIGPSILKEVVYVEQ